MAEAGVVYVRDNGPFCNHGGLRRALAGVSLSPAVEEVNSEKAGNY